MQRLDHDGLRTFIAIIESGGFTAAGRILGKSQASVSEALSRLEHGLKQRLVERTTRKLSLTASGHVLLDYARRLQALEEEAIEVVGGGTGRRVRIGMPDDYLERVGASILNQFAIANPGTQVETFCDFSSRLEEMIQIGAIDLAVITREPAHPKGELLREEPLVWFGTDAASPERLPELPLALFPEGCRARPRILDALRHSGRPWRVVYTSSHFHGVEAAVASGLAVTALPRCAASPRLKDLSGLPGLPPLPSVELAVLMRPECPPAAKRLAATVRGVLRATAAG